MDGDDPRTDTSHLKISKLIQSFDGPGIVTFPVSIVHVVLLTRHYSFHATSGAVPSLNTLKRPIQMDSSPLAAWLLGWF